MPAIRRAGVILAAAITAAIGRGWGSTEADELRQPGPGNTSEPAASPLDASNSESPWRAVVVAAERSPLQKRQGTATASRRREPPQPPSPCDSGSVSESDTLTPGDQGGSRLHWLSIAGYRMPVDASVDSQSRYWPNHIDSQLTDHIDLLGELNWRHGTKSGPDGIDGVEGCDPFDFGPKSTAGKDIATGAFDVTRRPHRHLELGVA
jgi:hypothetical protein